MEEKANTEKREWQWEGRIVIKKSERLERHRIEDQIKTYFMKTGY